ncbi:hypothetical protein Q8A67_004002 [Cirrhinus molitorella]|uniref:Uncharacterized protein n=1 Tax=Cirrhinus molitorella TaxID=172907 RepID=A0AA88Q459_9TELE|nr:hypothetical protein Q8A67_004002 [Cirrhinus molitorella]
MDCTIDDFKKKFHRNEISSYDRCDFYLFFCPIISRAGTDTDNALKYLDQVKAQKPVIMVVLHHTIDPEKTILDSNIAIKRENIFPVDCLFNDNGLLPCEKNTNAINKIAQDLKSKKLKSYYCLKNNHENPCLVTDQRAEMHQSNTREDVHSEKRGCCQFLKCLLCCCFRTDEQK